jgi:hypothetical protein
VLKVALRLDAACAIPFLWPVNKTISVPCNNHGDTMVRWLRRTAQRLLVFALGVLSVWFIVFVVFDFADQRLPWILALAVTYGIAAYVILPRSGRMGLKILQRQHVPRYTITGDGLPGDPVNLVLSGTREQLHAALAIAHQRRRSGRNAIGNQAG